MADYRPALVLGRKHPRQRRRTQCFLIFFKILQSQLENILSSNIKGFKWKTKKTISQCGETPIHPCKLTFIWPQRPVKLFCTRNARDLARVWPSDANKPLVFRLTVAVVEMISFKWLWWLRCYNSRLWWWGRETESVHTVQVFMLLLRRLAQGTGRFSVSCKKQKKYTVCKFPSGDYLLL